MAIKFYAGLITKANNVETVETFVPVNIVKPIGDSSWNSGKAYSYSVMPNEYPIYTECEVGFYDEVPVNFIDVIKTLYNIDDTWGKTEYEALFNGINEISFFSEKSIDSKLNFTMLLNSVVYDYPTRIYTRYQLGDQKRGILFQWETNFDAANQKLYLIMGEEYNDTSFESLLDTAREIERINFENLQYTNYMNYPQYALFAPYHGTGDKVSFCARYREFQAGVNKFGIALEHWANWYTMLTGKYYYGNPFVFELKNETNGFKQIELGVPIYLRDVLNEGLSTENPVANNGNYIGFTYYNVGTDLNRLFEWNELGTKNVALKTGILSKTNNSNGTYTITLSLDGKGLRIKNAKKQYDLHYNNVIDSSEYFSNYIFVHKDYATEPVKNWLNKISSNYSAYEYGNCPLFFASYSTADNIVIKYDYFNYVDYPNSRNPGLVSNIIINSSSYISLIDDSYEIDYNFWKDFLTGNTPTPTGPNIGGGSIGGGSSGSGGGNGKFDDGSDDIVKPGLPVSIGNTNLFKMYKIDNTALDVIGRWLHGDAVGIINITPYLNSIITLKQLRLPDVLTGTSQTITIGGQEVIVRSEEYSGAATGDLITSSYKQYDIGSFTFEEYFGSFLDYGKHTKIEIFLPMSGVHELDADIVMKSTIYVIANVNIISGEILYSIRVVNNNIDSVMYTFNGNCGCEIPITSIDYSGKIIAGIQTGMAGIAFGTSLLTGNFIGAMAGGAALGSSVLKQATTEHVSSAKGGVLSGSLGLMNIVAPYIMITRPKMSLPESYGHTIGYPCNISSNLSSLTGFTVVDEVHLEGFANATQSELDEIELSLKKGVIL